MQSLSEHARVRHAVLDSIKIGTLTDELVRLVHIITQRRCGPQVAEDIAQDVLLGLLVRLSKIDVKKNVYHYVCMAVVRCWRKVMRGRRCERRYLLRAAEELICTMPSEVRVSSSRQAFASSWGVFGLKYY